MCKTMMCIITTTETMVILVLVFLLTTESWPSSFFDNLQKCAKVLRWLLAKTVKKWVCKINIHHPYTITYKDIKSIINHHTNLKEIHWDIRNRIHKKEAKEFIACVTTKVDIPKNCIETRWTLSWHIIYRKCEGCWFIRNYVGI